MSKHLACSKCVSDASGGTLQYSPQKVSAFFAACCVLHNIDTDCRWQNISEGTLAGALQRVVEVHVPAAGDETWADCPHQNRDQLAEQLFPW